MRMNDLFEFDKDMIIIYYVIRHNCHTKEHSIIYNIEINVSDVDKYNLQILFYVELFLVLLNQFISIYKII